MPSRLTWGKGCSCAHIKLYSLESIPVTEKVNHDLDPVPHSTMKNSKVTVTTIVLVDPPIHTTITGSDGKVVVTWDIKSHEN